MSIRPQTATAADCMTTPDAAMACLVAVQEDLNQLETEFGQYLEQEDLKSDVQCLRTWIESYQQGDQEATEYLHEHGSAMLANIKEKLKTAAREIQRIDEESPVSENFSGGKADRLNNAAAAAIHAEDQLGKALNDTPKITESPIVAK